MDRNKHVKDYLEYYVNFKAPPHFAVLLNGPWGIGKTFLIKGFIKPFIERGLRHAYVSLYGLSSLDEIDDALFRSMYPILDNKGIRIAGRAAKIIGKYFRIELDQAAKDVLNKAKADLFIFDDLERCNIPINVVLGYINEFVEHEDKKVIIIANEEEIKESVEYKRIREKLIGKALELQSAFEQALDAFLGTLESDDARRFLAKKLPTVSEIYHQSELHNLRVLQQTMWDFERFYRALTDEHRSNDSAMTAMLQLLFAFSFELKAGRLKSNDLADRFGSLIASHMGSRRGGEAPSALAAAQLRYAAADLGTTALSDDTLRNLLIKGIVDTQQIRTELDASSFFVRVAEEPAWRTVWNGFERTEEEFNTALAEMERAFALREFTVPGEILHVFGLRLWLSTVGAIPNSREDTFAQCKSYVDDLYNNRRIEPPSGDGILSDLRLSGHGGLAVFERETLDYRELYAYLKDRQQAAAVDRYPAIANDLLAQMRADPDLFLRRISLTNQGQSEFYNIPVLASLEPEKFASAFLDLRPDQQRTVMVALSTRYEHAKLDRELKDERKWVTEVRDRLHAATESMSPFSKYRVRQITKFGLESKLEAISSPTNPPAD